MASKNSTAVVREPEAEATTAGQDLAAGLLAGRAAEIELHLADLISDERGEIVFFNDSGARSLGLTADSSVVAEGLAGHHVTASGADVSGYQFVTFANGLTLYFEDGVSLVLIPDAAA